ncbi:family 78 glycoside hydrolase catalytic domain [Jiangella alba]|uniref:alpha-L-rhamnosidase n=1 Tax=Jiangella alba TaxID=561176 RepID=A0A1H5JUH3_9ACTN|nr:family 78 glycoside hydrolase catalytic domain [Jiangella alba]SEE56283.1 alpha-L-rhamnosidase [Jiangella alba]
MMVPTQLRVEHVEHPLGLTVATPRLSWRLPSGANRQTAYRLRAGGWDSGRVASDQSLLVPYAGRPLRSGERLDWTVKVWTDAGESAWAEPAWWEMGLLAADDWVAQWIEPPQPPAGSTSPHPAHLVSGVARVDRSCERARLHVTAHGIYEFFINGERVGDAELTPGFTSYESTLQVQTFDVTDLIVVGQNKLDAVLSGGWVKWTRRYRHVPLGLLAQLHVLQTDGSLARFGTGPDWIAAASVVRTADLWHGQVVDLRAERGTGDPVRTRDFDPKRLRSSPAPPVRRIEELRAVSVTRVSATRQVIDLGQNVNGWIRLSKLGPEGTTLTVTYGEALDHDGDVTVDHVTGLDPEHSGSFQTDKVTTTGRPGATFEPRHTTHGFRYARVEGHPEDFDVDDVTGVVVHTDLRRTGWFECSDDRVNKLHEAAVWSFRGNACDIPTDCPTRERAGWSGDWQIFVSTAAFLYDVAGFSVKWLRDLAADQRPDGVVSHCVPNPEPDSFYADFPPGSAGWGDAAVIVPWEVYRAYGDLEVLEQQWPSMTSWVDYAARTAREHRHLLRKAARPASAPHEPFLWDTGFHWGEWLEPGADMSGATIAELRARDHGTIATAYLYHSARLLAQVAAALDRATDAGRYSDLAESVRLAWQTEFIREDGTIEPDTQASYVRALAFDLLPPEFRPGATERLVDLIRKADNHLGTGFLATPYLLPVLADNGHLDVAYELLFQDTEPSWLAMIDRGATTIWEQWNGIDKTGTPNASLNHYSKGAVVSFLHRYTAGIRMLDSAPAYRRFMIEPRPGGGITSAQATHDSPYGRIRSSWRVDGERFSLDVTVPPGTTAEVRLPDGRTFEARPGHHRTRSPFHAPAW